MEVKDNPLIDAEIVNFIRETLVQRQETIAVAESVTSGLIQAALSQAIEASKFYQGGITTFNIGQKYKHLNVEPIHAQSCDCISEKVASTMAIECCKLFNSHWGIGITGYATITPENNKLIAYYAISKNQTIVLAEKLEAPEKDPYQVVLFYMRQALGALANYFKAKSVAKR